MKFAAHRDKDGTYSVIKFVPETDLWIIYIPDAGSDNAARRIANLLNKES